jgi:hypothetical protein
MSAMTSCGELEERADFCWKRAVEVRSLARTLSSAESKEALLKMAEEYERVAEALTRAALLGGKEYEDSAGRLTEH